jgi:DNA-directed RNA polymerase subunit RPC12/RpoP
MERCKGHLKALGTGRECTRAREAHSNPFGSYSATVPILTKNQQAKPINNTKMKTNTITQLLLSALFSLCIVVPAAHADAQYEIYAPVSTPEQAETIKPGTRIAYICGACGAVVTMTADKDNSHLHGFTCPGCKRKFVRENIGGNVGTVDFSYVDDAGHHAKLCVIH